VPSGTGPRHLSFFTPQQTDEKIGSLLRDFAKARGPQLLTLMILVKLASCTMAWDWG
jgi:hypothetical protein